MAVMGMYCKAYPLERLREYPGWTERPGSLIVTDPDPVDAGNDDAGDGAADARGTGEHQESASAAAPQETVDYLFLQENYVVTNGVFLDEHIVFDAVTPEWETFCRTVLEFEVPPYEVKEPAPAEAAAEVQA